MSELEEGLLELERGLEGLLSMLEGASEPDPACPACERVERAFTRVRAELERAPQLRQQGEERVARCLRLYAVAVGQADGLREAFVRERAVCTQARTRLTRLHSGSASGATCDLSA